MSKKEMEELAYLLILSKMKSNAKLITLNELKSKGK